MYQQHVVFFNFEFKKFMEFSLIFFLHVWNITSMTTKIYDNYYMYICKKFKQI